MTQNQVTHHSMIDFIKTIQSTFKIVGEFDFSILMEKSPLKRTYDWCCKALAVIVSNGKTIYYVELQENDLQYINIKETPRRKMGNRNNPWFVDGNSKIQTFKDNDFIEYSFRNASNRDLKLVEKMRAKFDIQPPHEFTGKALRFNDDDFLGEN